MEMGLAKLAAALQLNSHWDIENSKWCKHFCFFFWASVSFLSALFIISAQLSQGSQTAQGAKTKRGKRAQANGKSLWRQFLWSCLISLACQKSQAEWSWLLKRSISDYCCFFSSQNWLKFINAYEAERLILLRKDLFQGWLSNVPWETFLESLRRIE